MLVKNEMTMAGAYVLLLSIHLLTIRHFMFGRKKRAEASLLQE